VQQKSTVEDDSDNVSTTIIKLLEENIGKVLVILSKEKTFKVRKRSINFKRKNGNMGFDKI
jgi:hypothetical protein